MSKDDPVQSVLVGFVLVMMFALFVAGIGLGRYFTSDWWQREAVKQNKAEYVVGESGESVWQWRK